MNAREKLAFVISFLVISTLGCGLFLCLGSIFGGLFLGVIAPIVFVTAMAVVHVLSAGIYRHEHYPPDSTPEEGVASDYVRVEGNETNPYRSPVAEKGQRSLFDWLLSKISAEYVPSLKVALWVDGVLLVLAALTLDSGRTLGSFLIAAPAHWGIIAVILLRRPASPGRFDLVFVRYGTLLIWLIAECLAPLVWSIIGESHLSGLERFRLLWDQ